ncbi:MAG: PorV/PorQ family protein [Candidatus Kryptonium sp.]|nr:PorV/PorQ family protein [Candidatus Kryptonium sp.]
MSKRLLKISAHDRLINLFLILYLFSISIAFSNSFKFSKYAGEFMSIGVGGRALGMGGAFTSVANDVTAGYWNPAGLAQLSSNTQLILMHDERFAGILNHDYFGLALKPTNFLSFALSIIRLGIDDIPYTEGALLDNNGDGIFNPEFDRIDPNKITFVSSSDWIVITSFAKSSNEKFSFGGNVKFIYRKIEKNSGIGVGFDAGVKFKVSNFSLGLVVKDITSTLIIWNTGKNELVVPSLITGISREFEILWGRLTPSLDLITRFEGRNKTAFLGTNFVSFDINIGGEYTFKDLLSVRSGFTENGEFTLGAGVKLNRLDIDYSFARFSSELGNTHRVSLKFSIN